MKSEYQLLDSGEGRKLEVYGDYIIDRPSQQAVWPVQFPNEWKQSQLYFKRRNESEGDWKGKSKRSWVVNIDGIHFQLEPSPFGHLGVFPEQRKRWQWLKTQAKNLEKPKVLNLFAYTGGSSIASALGGAQVVHIDASKPMMERARKNAQLSKCSDKSIAWIVEDALKFLRREVRRGKQYQGIIMDPPSYGRGPRGQIFKIERDLPELLDLAIQLLDQDQGYLLVSCHTPGYTPTTLHNILKRVFKTGIESGEMLLEGQEKVLPLPSGVYAHWSAHL